jgi:hypothetical protein
VHEPWLAQRFPLAQVLLTALILSLLIVAVLCARDDSISGLQLRSAFSVADPGE